MGEAAIAAEQLIKRYGEIEAVRGIDLSVMPGETSPELTRPPMASIRFAA